VNWTYVHYQRKYRVLPECDDTTSLSLSTMITDSAALVLFAIRSSVRLGHEARQAYVDATRRRHLSLPLPNFFSSSNAADAFQYFAEGSLG
jgi:hypothetical protein